MIKSPDRASRSYRAMLLAMEGEISYAAAAERFGVATSTVYTAIKRERERQQNIWPEDEVTC